MKNKKILAVSFVLLLAIFGVFFLKNQPEFISKAKFKELILKNEINKAKLGSSFITLYTKEGKFLIAKEATDLKELNDSVLIEPAKENYLLYFLGFIFVFLLLFLLFFNKKSKDTKAKQIQNALKNPSSEFKPVISKLSFKDVAGAKVLKEELYELVDFLKNPKKYQDFGIKMPKGVLMIGPPGVGKTLVAKAVAGEAGVPFFYQSGASFVEIYVGMGAKRVKELFSKAKSMAPSIIFIDEIDAVGKERGGLANTERDSTLNQLLTQMDGFEDSSGVMVIAATNKIELLDEALLRAGRFDRRIFLSLPDFKDREDIINIYMLGKKSNANIAKIAKSCIGFSAASLETLVNEASINALRRGSKLLEDRDFDEVAHKVLHGKKSLQSLNDRDKDIQAIYQAAKALCAYYFGIDYERFTLVEDRFSGFDSFIKSKSELLALLKLHLCGMMATRENYKESFTNSGDDLLKAKELTSYMQGFEMLKSGELEEVRQNLAAFVRANMDDILSLSKLLLKEEKLEIKDVEKLLKEK